MIDINPEEFKKLTGGIDPLPAEVVEWAKLKLRLQEAEEQYKIAHEKFMDMFDEAWNEVLSEIREKAGEAVVDDNYVRYSSLKSDLVKKWFKKFIEHEPDQYSSLFLMKWWWKMVIEHELGFSE